MKANVRDDHEAEVRRVIEPLLSGEAPSTAELADEAAYSRFHFHRIFSRLMGETPGGMRRRLLLERAAWLIAKQGESATETAFEVGFGSLEGFSRAFKKAFGSLPSEFASVRGQLWLPTTNGVHYSPLALMPQGGKNMDLIDRLLDHDLAIMRQILNRAAVLSEEQLDSPLPMKVQALCYEEEQNSIRELIEMIVFTKEIWIAAVEHQAFPNKEDRTINGLTHRAEVALPMFAALVRRVRDAGEWDTEFSDDLCEQPERFSFGGMIAQVITTNAYRRSLLVALLESMGGKFECVDPLDWERAPRVTI